MFVTGSTWRTMLGRCCESSKQASRVRRSIGGNSERTNLEVVRGICAALDDLIGPTRNGTPHEALVTFVADRPGHDLRYAVDSSRIEAQLGWRPRTTFEDGLHRTVRWYVENEAWWRPILDGGTYGTERLGGAD